MLSWVRQQLCLMRLVHIVSYIQKVRVVEYHVLEKWVGKSTNFEVALALQDES